MYLISNLRKQCLCYLLFYEWWKPHFLTFKRFFFFFFADFSSKLHRLCAQNFTHKALNMTQLLMKGLLLTPLMALQNALFLHKILFSSCRCILCVMFMQNGVHSTFPGIGENVGVWLPLQTY